MNSVLKSLVITCLGRSEGTRESTWVHNGGLLTEDIPTYKCIRRSGSYNSPMSHLPVSPHLHR